MNNTLYEITDKYLKVLDNLEIDEETGEILNAEELDELSGAFEEKSEAVACYIKNSEVFIGDLKAEEANLAKRRKQTEKRIDYLKNVLTACLDAAGRDKVETTKVRVSFRKSVAVSIDDEKALPADFVVETVTTKPDKTAIKKATSNKNDSPLHVLPVAERLIDYTLDLTDNAKRFPKRVRFSITNKIQGHVMAIYDDLLEANEIFPIRTEADRSERLRLQRTALTECKKLLHMIELSKKRTYIDKDTFDYWTKLTLDVKFMTAKWYKAEQDTAEAIAPSDPIPESV